MIEQPMPVEGKRDVSTEVEAFLETELEYWGPKVSDFILTRFTERNEKGIETYGTPLQTHNGRDAVLDAIDEALDMTQYLMQSYLEAEAGTYERAKTKALFEESVNFLLNVTRYYLMYGQDVVKQADTRTIE